MRKRATWIIPLAVNSDKCSTDNNNKIGVKSKSANGSSNCSQSAALTIMWLVVTLSVLVMYEVAISIRSPGKVPESTILSQASSFASAAECTSKQLDSIRKQLNPGHVNCHEDQYNEQCPITVATKCYKDSWLINYYSRQDIFMDSFLAVTVGCNAGYRSVDLLRMGTMDPSVDVVSWASALKNSGSDSLKIICQVEEESGHRQAFVLPDSLPRRKGTVYCVEEHPNTVDAIGVANINNANSFASKGLVVHHSLIASSAGKVYHPKAGSAGPCDTDAQRAENCVSVPMQTLDDFAAENAIKTGNINVLEISNGNEFDALHGGINTLHRTEYVLLRVDWKGNWDIRGRSVASVLEIFHNAGFTCYWAGMDKLWRITSCPFKEYSSHKFQASMACANRKLAPLLLDEMEKQFLNTIHQ